MCVWGIEASREGTGYRNLPLLDSEKPTLPYRYLLAKELELLKKL